MQPLAASISLGSRTSLLAQVVRGSRTMASSSRAALQTLEARLNEEMDGMREAGTYKTERVITSPQDSKVSVSGREDKVLNFCANNYLGLSDHPEVVKAAHEALDSHGFGMSSVRFICGTQDIHKELETKIAKFHDMDDCILFPSCFDANAGLFEAILGPEDALISDSLNHASIIDGVRLCKAQRHRYKHMDMVDLEEKLVAAKDARVRLIVTDGVFSMDGDVAPLRDICDLAEKHDALVFIDECHATGFFGETGRGTIEHCDVHGPVAIINSTLGKALGGATGGYTAAIQPVVDILRQKARPYLFSNAVAPAVVGASLKVFDMLSQPDNPFVAKVRKNTHLFRDRLTKAGFRLSGDYDHPIVPVMLGDARLASEMADDMLQRGVYVIGFSFPVVPRGEARIRTQISAAHSEDDVNFAADAFIEIGKKHGVIN
ncbi:5-aminolevulinate synthase, mitochondrial [Hondaea fermentalgiana]|uniref:5-aminolevulinate synthase, mitochondrial n=1 Tax=Hondaea fermentalgiana TaxID=2315210 RepID=A0A2R5G376_9STRA|nr:5-aminolevulinate synthase, mitochondrial [Hondaea fermentalgiana]|eukprot:GBG25462.1 5-aminolevulinate synthase, mitochondrial [Hondaea fermentalgiana]